jgi:methylated-DNA-[protein]-cysteine S-methyltransferase
MSVTIFRSRWGWMGISETAQGIDAIVLPKSSRKAVEFALGTKAAESVGSRISPRLRAARTQVIAYLSGKRTNFDLPLDLSRGTDFQRRVWRTLQRIPCGTLRSYQWVAVQVGGRRYARAVGNAVGANPVPIVIPCHRIIAHDGTIGGFSCGLPAKRMLLTREGLLSQIKF